MPKMMELSRSCTIALPPASRIRRSPSAPSRPIPVSTTPIAARPNVPAIEKKSGSAAGLTPHIVGDSSSRIVALPGSPLRIE